MSSRPRPSFLARLVRRVLVSFAISAVIGIVRDRVIRRHGHPSPDGIR